jgi:hypothetical protein
MAYHRRHDIFGVYGSKNVLEAPQAQTPIEVTYDEKQAIFNAWEGAL